MRREVSRERKLAAFRLTIAGLDVLIQKVLELFGNSRPSLNIRVRLKNQLIDFESLDEIKEFKELPDRITFFSILVSGGGKGLSIDSGGVLGSPSFVETNADSEAWCAGAIEVVSQFLQQYRAWYSWFRGWPLGATVFVSFWIPFTIKTLGFASMVNSDYFIASWVVAEAVLVGLYFSRRRLFPTAVLEISRTDNFIRRYMPELMLLLALLSMVLTIFGWFVSKNV